MKLTALVTPVLIASLSVATIGGLGTLAVRSSTVSIQTNIKLLRMNLRVARLHEELLRHSQDALSTQAQTLPPPGAPGRAKHEETKDATPPEPESTARPWPETVQPWGS